MMQTVITSNNNSILYNAKEIWNYRELLWVLAWRDFRVRYAQSLLGVLWAIINPLLMVLLLSFVFGIIVKVDTAGVPHILYTMAGMLGWTFFSSLTSDAGRSIIGAQNMIKKIYFPRLIIPLSKLLTGVVDFLIVLFVFFLLMFYYAYLPSLTIIYFPLFILVTMLLGIGSGIWISALTIRYRDFQHIVPVLLRVGMYATPIAYPASAVPEKYEALYFLNPLAGIVEGMRWSLLGIGDNPSHLWISVLVTIVLLCSGFLYFNSINRTIADII